MSYTRPGTALKRIADIEAEEIQAVLWAGFYFFFILAGYYVIRPMRDEMAVAGGIRNLPWLFTATLVVMLLVNPLFASLVTNLPRKRFVSLTYRFFLLNLAVFYLLLSNATESQNIWIGRIFYVWTSVFNLFVVSVFWGFMADIFSRRQGKRLFGLIAFGGTLGGIAGSMLTSLLVEHIGPLFLILLAAGLIECSVQCMNRLCYWSARTLQPARMQTLVNAVPVLNPIEGTPEAVLDHPDRFPVGGKILAGFTHVVRSPYLLGISLYMLAYTVTATFLYFQQAQIVESAFSDRNLRTAIFARIDLAVNSLTVITQLFLTARVIRWLGIGLTLALLPAICLVGFSALGFYTALPVLVTFQVLRRAGNFAIARPARETLYTVLSREDKYKAKTLIDTFVYRAGDQVGAWAYAGLLALGLTVSGVAWAALPVTGVWIAVSLWLGKKQQAAGGGAGDADPRADSTHERADREAGERGEYRRKERRIRRKGKR